MIRNIIISLVAGRVYSEQAMKLTEATTLQGGKVALRSLKNSATDIDAFNGVILPPKSINEPLPFHSCEPRSFPGRGSFRGRSTLRGVQRSRSRTSSISRLDPPSSRAFANAAFAAPCCPAACSAFAFTRK